MTRQEAAPPTNGYEAIADSTGIKRTVFVIMPFGATITRTESDLTEFFQTNLKARIEGVTLAGHHFVVRRSDDTFDITERIIQDLYEADFVICDLSGADANPNVMYELGVRLAITNKPVILIREASTTNRRIFDIQGFYAFEYSATRYRPLEDHILQKLSKFVSSEEAYQSPVLKVLEQTPSVVHRVRAERVSGILRMVNDGLFGTYAAADLVLKSFLKGAAVDIPEEKMSADAMFESPEKFSSLPWPSFTLRPRVLPALQTFLSEPLLRGLLPAETEAAVTKRFALYYSVVYAIEEDSLKQTFGSVLKFFGETYRASALARATADYIDAGNDKARESSMVIIKHLIDLPVKQIGQMINFKRASDT